MNPHPHPLPFTAPFPSSSPITSFQANAALLWRLAFDSSKLLPFSFSSLLILTTAAVIPTETAKMGSRVLREALEGCPGVARPVRASLSGSVERWPCAPGNEEWVGHYCCCCTLLRSPTPDVIISSSRSILLCAQGPLNTPCSTSNAPRSSLPKSTSPTPASAKTTSPQSKLPTPFAESTHEMTPSGAQAVM